MCSTISWLCFFLLRDLDLHETGFKDQPLPQGGLLFQPLQGLQQHIVEDKGADQQAAPAEQEKPAVHAALQILAACELVFSQSVPNYGAPPWRCAAAEWPPGRPRVPFSGPGRRDAGHPVHREQEPGTHRGGLRPV